MLSPLDIFLVSGGILRMKLHDALSGFFCYLYFDDYQQRRVLFSFVGSRGSELTPLHGSSKQFFHLLLAIAWHGFIWMPSQFKQNRQMRNTTERVGVLPWESLSLLSEKSWRIILFSNLPKLRHIFVRLLKA